MTEQRQRLRVSNDGAQRAVEFVRAPAMEFRCELPDDLCSAEALFARQWPIRPESSALVFTSSEGEPLRRNNFRRRVWYPAVKRVGLDGLRFHDLRHTGATLAAATGAPLRAIMARLGHATPVAALRYQQVVAGQDADIATNLDQIARRAIGGEPDGA